MWDYVDFDHNFYLLSSLNTYSHAAFYKPSLFDLEHHHFYYASIFSSIHDRIVGDITYGARTRGEVGAAGTQVERSALYNKGMKFAVLLNQ